MVRERMGAIEACWDLRGEDERSAKQVLIVAANRVPRMLGPSGYNGTAITPADFIVAQYMNGRIPGYWAIDLLASAISYQHLMMAGSIDEHRQLFHEDVDHLAETVAGLVAAVRDYDVKSFYEMTYLAGLYAHAGRMLIDIVPEGVLADADQQRFPRLAHNLEEVYVHEVVAPLRYPADFYPHDLYAYLIEVASDEGATPVSIGTDFCLHPAYLEAISTLPNTAADDPEVVWATYRDAARERPALPIDEYILDAGRPLSAHHVDRLT